MKNVKYMAGFLDADGSYGIGAFKTQDDIYTIYPTIHIAQCTYQDKPLKILAEEFGVEGHYRTFEKENWCDTFNVLFSGKKATRLMEQVKNHSVIKRDLIEFILTLSGLKVTKEELKGIKKQVKEARKASQSKVKPFPSRQWLAGYFDGDGCITSTMYKDGTLITFITISCWKYDREGVELIQKFFGGSIQESKEQIKYRLNITESNCTKVVEYFAKNTISKREQLYSVINYVGKGKHLKRRGATTEQNTEFRDSLSAMKRGRID